MKISSKQLFVFAVFLTVSLFVGFGNPLILRDSGNATLFACFLGFLLGFIILYFILKIADITNFNNIFKGLKEKNKVFGSILNILFVIFALYILCLNTWNFVNFIISDFLTRNSHYVFAIVFFLIIAYMVSKNKEVMGRVIFILFLIVLPMYFIAVGFLIPKMSLDNFFPIFDVSIPSFIKSVLSFPTYAVLPLFYILIIGKKDISDKKNYNKAILLGYMGGCFIIMTILFLVISVYGIDVAKLFAYPSYTILRKIHAFDFIERIENILSLFFFVISLCSLGTEILFIKSFIIDTFKVRDEKKDKLIIYIISLVIPLFSIYYFKHNFIFDLYILYPYIAISMIVLIFITFIYVKKLKEKDYKLKDG